MTTYVIRNEIFRSINFKDNNLLINQIYMLHEPWHECRRIDTFDSLFIPCSLNEVFRIIFGKDEYKKKMREIQNFRSATGVNMAYYYYYPLNVMEIPHTDDRSLQYYLQDSEYI